MFYGAFQSKPSIPDRDMATSYRFQSVAPDGGAAG